MIELNFVLYVPACKSVFGPFDDENLACLWAVRGVGNLEYEILRYIDVERGRPESSREQGQP